MIIVNLFELYKIQCVVAIWNTKQFNTRTHIYIMGTYESSRKTEIE